MEMCNERIMMPTKSRIGLERDRDRILDTWEMGFVIHSAQLSVADKPKHHTSVFENVYNVQVAINIELTHLVLKGTAMKSGS